MTDYRSRLYDHYLTRFVDINPLEFERLYGSWKVWADNKIFPLIQDLNPDARVLELGSGPGQLLRFLTEHGFTELAGIDISEEQVKFAKSQGCAAEVADAKEFLADKADTYDVIFALDFVEHFYKDELIPLFDLIHQALKKNGRLIIQTPNGEGLFPRQIIFGDLTHLTIFTPSSLQQILREIGFQEFQFFETGPAPKNLSNRLRIFIWGLIKIMANMVRRIEANKSQAIWTENFICSCKRS